LPQAGRIGGGQGLRVEGGFDEGQQRQFGRHAALFQLFHHVVEVERGARHGTVDIVLAVGVPLDMLADQGVVHVGNGIAGADAAPDVGFLVFFDGRLQDHGFRGVRRCQGGGCRDRGDKRQGDQDSWFESILHSVSLLSSRNNGRTI
jgi:hypothetical protein